MFVSKAKNNIWKDTKMKPYQKSNSQNGKENFLFPLEYLYCTQGEHDTDYYAMDFSGWGPNGKVYDCPMYAPFSCHCVYVGSLANNTPMCIWESDSEVNFVNGEVDYACILVAHDDNFNTYKVGDTRSQGDVFAHTGNTGLSSGDHTHIIVGKGQYNGLYTSPNGHYTLRNQYHIYDAVGVNDTYLIQTQGIDWKSFSDTPIPPTPKKDDFIILSVCNALKWSV